ncbi:MAG: hypothetical protein NTV94_09370 [Planctomycetota bacterium]|nr:hypothetical protein [Planctomycetota bacterium]
MAGGRHSQPLFDLVRNRGNVNTPQDRRTTMNPGVGWRPGMAPGTEPAPAPDGDQTNPATGPMTLNTPVSSAKNSPSRDMPPEGSAGADAWAAQTGIGGATVRVPVNAVYLVAAGFVLFIVVAYGVGSFLSRRDAERDQAASREQPPISEPLDSPVPVGSALDSSGLQRPATRGEAPTASPANDAAAQPAPPSVPRPSDALCLTSKGWTTSDQRDEGLNYLLLAYVSQTEAEDAISFLAENGLETFALYVDPSQVRGNNFSPTRPYKLYASKGITSDEYSKKMTAKTNVEAAVARLGPRWQKERKGSSNFSKPAWEKK